MPQTLYEVFRERVMRNKAVQRERKKALKESRQPGAQVSTETVELLFDHLVHPSPYWSWSISTQPSEPPPRITALWRGFLAIECEWHQIVRELRDRKMIATGKKPPENRATLDADEQEVDHKTWLNVERDLRYNVPDHTVVRVRGDGSTSRQWVEIRVHKVDEAVRMAAEEDEPRSPAPAAIHDGVAALSQKNKPRTALQNREAVRKSLEYIVRLLSNSPDKPTQKKAEVEAYCRQHFGVTVRDFDAAWKQARKDVPTAGSWFEPGLRKTLTSRR